MPNDPNTPIPATHLPVRSLQLASLGKDVLAVYCARMMDAARAQDDMQAYMYYSNLANLISDVTTGLILGSLLYEARLITDDPTISIPVTPSLSQALSFYMQDTHKMRVPF